MILGTCTRLRGGVAHDYQVMTELLFIPHPAVTERLRGEFGAPESKLPHALQGACPQGVWQSGIPIPVQVVLLQSGIPIPVQVVLHYPYYSTIAL